MRSRVPVARATFSSVRVDGHTRPLSSRATTDWVVAMRSASSAWVRCACVRASMSARATTTRRPRDAQRPRDTAAVAQAYLPQRPGQVPHVRRAHAVQSDRRDQLADARESTGAGPSTVHSMIRRNASRYAFPGGRSGVPPAAVACSAGSNGMTTSGRRSASA